MRYVSPDALIGQRIVYGPAATVSTAWTFTHEGVTTTVQIEANISLCDNEGAKAGLGINSIGFWASRRELEDGSDVPILADWSLGSTKVHGYFRLDRATGAAARALINFLVDEFSESIEVARAR